MLIDDSLTGVHRDQNATEKVLVIDCGAGV